MKTLGSRPLSRLSSLLFFLLLSPLSLVSGIQLDPKQPAQIRHAAKQVAAELVSMYAATDADGHIQPHSGIPGLLPNPPYYWWEAGAMFGTLIEYWYYTGDDTYNELVKEGILFQIGERADLMPANRSKEEGNDDQLFWAFTVMTAAELGFPDPEPPYPGWLALAQSVMNQLISRWNPQFCTGGLRWQIYQWLNGYNYKNTAANGGMFQLGARLAKYTGNKTYADWAEKAYDWLAADESHVPGRGKPLVTESGKIFDGTDIKTGCQKVDKTQWSYNYGIMIGGAAYMYNYTSSLAGGNSGANAKKGGIGDKKWAHRLANFLNHTSFFFPADRAHVMSEICEPKQKCNPDQWSFKAYLSRWLAVAAQLAPFTESSIMPVLEHSAAMAAAQCDGGDAGATCGSRWWFNSSDGNAGVGQQMSALSIIQSCLVRTEDKGPLTGSDGGTSVGDPSAGTKGEEPSVQRWAAIEDGDKAGASLLTVLVVGATLGTGWWIVKADL